jgi:hypothetical protein
VSERALRPEKARCLSLSIFDFFFIQARFGPISLGSSTGREVESNQIKTKPLQSDYTGRDGSVELLTCSSIVAAEEQHQPITTTALAHPNLRRSPRAKTPSNRTKKKGAGAA